MPLRLSPAPPNAFDLVASTISQLSATGGAASVVAGARDPASINAALQHKVYTLGSTDIAQSTNLGRARLAAWRFLIQHGLKTVAAIEFLCDAAGTNLRFASLDIGPFAQGTRDAVRLAEGLDPVKSGSYELRVLRAPSVYVMAAWLKNLDGGDDIVIPIRSEVGARGFAAVGGEASIQSQSDFISDLRSAAQTALQFDSRPQSDGRPGGRS